jgi:hypothetical protein
MWSAKFSRGVMRRRRVSEGARMSDEQPRLSRARLEPEGGSTPPKAGNVSFNSPHLAAEGVDIFGPSVAYLLDP